MKKFTLISALVLIFVLFSACLSGSPKAESLKFYANDGTIAPQYYSEAELTFTPDYKAKSLYVEYSRVFPKRTNETGESDLKTSGDIGEEYFSRFEELTSVVKNYEEPENVNNDDYLGSGVFGVVLTEEGGAVSKIESFWNIEAEDFQALQSFYLDIVNLLTQEVPV